MPVLPGAALTATVQQMEKAGFEGVFVLQIYGPPFVPLAAASTVTETLKLGTGIAFAGKRSPLETAYAAMDLDRSSDGRFILGLGSSIPSCTTGMYGAPSFMPLGHLRDTVTAVRSIIPNP